MDIAGWGQSVLKNIATVFIGKEQSIQHMLAGILAGGHVLLDDVPGLGKTRLAKALAISLGSTVSRIQCTPDLMPADITGVSIFLPQESSFKFRKGPLLHSFVLVDEINRATPRTQSALLEAMAENQITVEGKTINLPETFIVIATQNPVDFEGTYPLPEAQKDRFIMTLHLGYLDKTQEMSLFDMKNRETDPLDQLKAVCSWNDIPNLKKQLPSIHVSDNIRTYIMDLVEASRASNHVRMGVSPRGSLALFKCGQALAALKGRSFVTPDDIKDLAIPVLVSRIIPRQQALIKGIDHMAILNSIIDSVPVPVVSQLG